MTPRTYLRGFADADGLLTVRRRAGAEMNLHIANVAVRSGFYNVQDSTGTTHDAVERWFMEEIEDPAGRVLQNLRREPSAALSPDDSEALSNFVSAQLYRTPTARSYMVQVDRQLEPLLFADGMARAQGRRLSELTPSERAFHERNARQIMSRYRSANDVRASQLRTTLREIDKMMCRLQTYRWEVANSEVDCLITGDAPAFGLQARIGAFAGVLPSGSPVYLPLSPRRLLVGSPNGTGLNGRLSTALATAVNFRIAHECDDAIVKSTRQDWPLRARLATQQPQLPGLPVDFRVTTGKPTFPARHAPVASPSIRRILEVLEAEDHVN